MTRKPFDDETGKHVTAPATLQSDDEIFEPAPHVVRALEIKCRICNAKPGERCGSIIDASKYLDVPHAGRIEAARSKS